MVNKCCVKGCKSKWCPGSSIKFHRFPSNIILRNQWLAVVKLKTNLYRYASICSLHFKSTDYDKDTQRLKTTAVPFFKEALKSNSVEHHYKLYPAPDQDEIITSYLDITDSSSNDGDLKQEHDYVTHSAHHQEEMILPDSEITDCSSNDVTDLKQEHNYASHSAHHQEMIIPDSEITDCSSNNVTDLKKEIPCDFNQYYLLNLKQIASENAALVRCSSPLDKNVQANLKSPREILLQKKKKVLEQKVGRLSKQIESMSSLVASIKTYFSQSEIENIISGNFADLQRKLYKKKKIQSPYGLRFSDEVKNFALNLHFQSPQAYNYLKKYLTLPHPSTLYKPQKHSDSEQTQNV